jgi:hypothetical protein
MSSFAMIFRREMSGSRVEDAVDTEANPELLLVRLDVDVRRSRLQRLDQYEIRYLDDRRRLGRLREVDEVDLLAFLPADDVDVVDARDLVHVDLGQSDTRHVVHGQRRAHEVLDSPASVGRCTAGHRALRPLFQHDRPRRAVMLVDRPAQ